MSSSDDESVVESVDQSNDQSVNKSFTNGSYSVQDLIDCLSTDMSHNENEQFDYDSHPFLDTIKLHSDIRSIWTFQSVLESINQSDALSLLQVIDQTIKQSIEQSIYCQYEADDIDSRYEESINDAITQQQSALSLMSGAARLLEAIVDLIDSNVDLQTINQSNNQSNNPFLETMLPMHDALLSFLHPSGTSTQAQWARTLRKYWIRSINPTSDQSSKRGKKSVKQSINQPIDQSINQILPMLMSYHCLRVHEGDAKTVDLHNLVSINQTINGTFNRAINQFDWNDQSINQLKQLLIRCSIHPMFLRNVEGRRFIAELFAINQSNNQSNDESSESINQSMIDELHQAIKAQLPNTRKSLIDCYGDVYYRAWKNLLQHQSNNQSSNQSNDESINQGLVHFEENCLQDLMYIAINCSNQSISQSIRRLLHVIHSKRRTQSINLSISRLYQPILWRSIKSINQTIRHNAIGVLIDIFPVQSINQSNNQSIIQSTDLDDDQSISRSINQPVNQEDFMSYQLGLIIESINETNIQSRIQSINGLAALIEAYYEIIPINQSINLIDCLIDRSFDCSSVAVRVASVRSINRLVKNHQTINQTINQSIKLSPLINDRSPLVQIEMVNLLQSINQSSIQSVNQSKNQSNKKQKWWKIVSIDSLIDCLMRSSNQKLSVKITELLLNSFVPINQSELPVTQSKKSKKSNNQSINQSNNQSNDQSSNQSIKLIGRMVKFIEKNPVAAHAFYSRLINLSINQSIVCLIDCLFRCFVQCLDDEQSINQSNNQSSDASNDESEEEAEKENKKKNKRQKKNQQSIKPSIKQSNNQYYEIDLSDLSMLEHLLSIFSTLWQSINQSINQTTNKTNKLSLISSPEFRSLVDFISDQNQSVNLSNDDQSINQSLLTRLLAKFSPLTPTSHSTFLFFFSSIQSINESSNESINQSKKQTKKSKKQSDNQSIDQTISQSVLCPELASVSLIDCLIGYQSFNQVGVHEYGPLIDCLIDWSQIDTLIERCNQSINQAFDQNYFLMSIDERMEMSFNNQTVKPKKGKKKESINQSMVQSMDPVMAIKYLNYCFDNERIRTMILNESVKKQEVTQSLNQSIDQSITQSDDQPVRRKTKRSLNQSIKETINRSEPLYEYVADGSINHTVIQLKPVVQMINQCRLIDRLVDEIDLEKSERAVNQSINQTINENRHLFIDHDGTQLNDQTIERLIKQSIKESSNQSISESREFYTSCISLMLRISLHLFNQSVNQSISQSSEHDSIDPVFPSLISQSIKQTTTRSAFTRLTLTFDHITDESNNQSNNQSNKRLKTNKSKRQSNRQSIKLSDLSWNERYLLTVARFTTDCLVVGLVDRSMIDRLIDWLNYLHEVVSSEQSNNQSITQSAFFLTFMQILHKAVYHLTLHIVHDPLFDWSGQSMDQSIDQSLDQSLNQSISQSERSIGWSHYATLWCSLMGLLDERLSNDQSINQSINMSIKSLIQCNTPIDQPIDQVSEPINQTINLLISTSLVINDSGTRQILSIISRSPQLIFAILQPIQSINQAIIDTISQTISQSVDSQPDEQELVEQPINQSITALERLIALIAGLIVCVDEQTQSIKRSMNQAINQTTHQKNKRDRAFDVLNQCLLVIEQSIKQTINQSNNQSISFFDQSTEMINQLKEQILVRQTSESTHQSNNQQTVSDPNDDADHEDSNNQSNDQSNDQSVDQSIDQSVDQSVEQSVDQSDENLMVVKSEESIDSNDQSFD